MKGNLLPSRKKDAIPLREPLKVYLAEHGRAVELPLQYDDLLRYTASVELIHADGHDTLWETVYYGEADQKEIYRGLTYIYALLKTDGDVEVMEHLTVARIDFCTFGNTKPFRVRIINRLNDNYDHFYVKRADASRVYGLELEDLLSPNRVTYLAWEGTLIEEHIAGIPGDDFMKYNLDTSLFNQTRIAKEFVKFNERCFVRLLGDMRAYNYVVDITPDIEGNQYRMRAIDFDQQSFEGRKSFYLPQYFKDNNPVIFLGIHNMAPEAVRQYQMEERSLISVRVKSSHARFSSLMSVMVQDEISTPDKTAQLREELAAHHGSRSFERCQSMGEVVLANIQLLMDKHFR